MRSTQFGPASSSLTLLPIAVLGLAVLVAGCTPNLENKLLCQNSTQCPTGYFCAADSKCQQGDTVPEIVVLTQTAGITFSGAITLEMSVIDPSGVTGVTVGLAGPGADAGSAIAATPGTNNIYTATLDTHALGIAATGSFTATITATNSKNKTSTVTVPLALDDEAPTLGSVSITPASVTAGQPATITFHVGEALAVLPVVKLTPPDSSAPRHAAYVSLNINHTYTYQFVPLSTDPLGSWKVQVTAQDSFGNSASSAGNDAFTVAQGGAQSVTFAAKRDADGVTDLRAYSLKSGATVTVTATFGAALGGNPTGFLCPVATPGPCTGSTPGESTITSTAGTGNSYVFKIPAVIGSSGSSSEGNHAFTVTGSGGSGSAISGSVNIIYDFTAPNFSIQQLDAEHFDDHSPPRSLISKQGYPEGIHYLLVPREALLEQVPPVVTLDGAPSTFIKPTTNPMSPLLPEFTLTPDATLASTPPVPEAFAGHVISFKICDAATNCTSVAADPFVEVDGPALIAFTYPADSDVAADGGVQVHKSGDTVIVGVDLDRTLGTDSSNYSILVSLTDGHPNDQIDFDRPPFSEPSLKPLTPFGYFFSTTIPPGASDGTYAIQVTYGYDGYGNYLSNGFSTVTNTTPVVQTVGPFVTIKNSIPQLFTSNSGGGVINTQPPTLTPASAVNIYFIAESNGVANAYEDLSKGSITACVNPAITSASLVCPSGGQTSNNGVTVTVAAPTGTSSNGVQHYIGEISLKADATAGNGQQFVLVNYTDAAGNVGALPININVATHGPSLGAVQFDRTVVGPGQTATALISTDEALPASGVVGSAGNSLTGVTSTTTSSNVARSYLVAFKMPAQCNGGVNPTDGAPFLASVTLSDGSYVSGPIPLGNLTCVATSIANSTVNAASIYLVKAPRFDGTVRSVVFAAPGAITGISGTGPGVTLIATNSSGAVIGSGPVLADGSVAEFQLTGAQTQVTLRFADLLGNSKAVAAGYPEQLLINGTGAAAATTSNPFLLVDVGTGDDAFYPAGYWVDGGPGPDGGVAGPVRASLLADGGGAQTAANAQALLAGIDNQVLQLSSAPAFDTDAGGPYRPASIGFEPMVTPIFSNLDGGVLTAQTPSARYSAGLGAYAYANGGVFMYGGTSASGFADPIGTYWQWLRDTGWVKSQVTVFDGGTPSQGAVAIGFDNNGDPLVLGGVNPATGGAASGIAGLYTNYLADGGTSQYWGDAGTLTYAAQMASSANGLGSFYYQVAPGSPTYAINNAMMTVMNPAGSSGASNCEVAIAGCGTAQTYCPGGNIASFSCANQGGLAGATHNSPALAVASASGPDGGTYGLFSFGGKHGPTNDASNDLYGGMIVYSNGTLAVNWVPLAASSTLPPARYQAALYFIPQTNRLGLYGGTDGINLLTDNWEYDLATNAWTKIDTSRNNAIVPSGKSNPGYASFNGNGFVYGGLTTQGYQSDGWTFGRETRNRFIARLPIASQLTNAAGATVSSLNITLATPSSHFQGNGRTLQGHSPELVTPDQTTYDSYFTYDLYLWTGTFWQLVEDTGSYVQSLTIPGALLPSITAGDGNLYVMVAGAPTGYANSLSAPIILDALDFTLNFQ